ncbi:MAG TPA: DUF3347 domain-containing protein [Arenibacter sp.]|nr:DUF3347 domain-containing protein [Arenibacter sp.]
MKKVSTSITILALGFLTFGAMSCKEAEKGSVKTEVGVSAQGNVGDQETSEAGTIIDSYLTLKDALVADSQEQAAKAGEVMAKNVSEFDLGAVDASKRAGLEQIIATAKEKSTQIAKSDIAEQREHFEGLSASLVDFVAITGTPITLYQQFCPMYNNDKGGMWVSAVKAIKNPYFGSGMLNCGFVQKEIN